MMKKLCANCDCFGWGLLVIRLGLGAGFIAHGFQKFSAMDGTIAFFSSVNLPAALAYLVAAIELLGGIAMVLGVFTTIAGALLALVMVGAIILVKFKMGFLGGFEMDTLYLAMALGIVLAGPGAYSAACFFKKKETPAGGNAPMQG